MVKVLGVPTQPLAVGVTVIVAITVAVLALVAVKEGMSPVPLPARPMDGVLLTQAKVVPATGPEIVMADVVAPLQYATLLIALTVAVGYTVMVNEMGGPTQPLAVGVTVMVAITVVMPALVAVKDGIFPVPLPASPMDGVLLTHAKVAPVTGLPRVIRVVVAPLQ
jgi:hypothetical protein